MDGVTEERARYIWTSNFPDNYDAVRKLTVKSGLNPAYIRDVEIAYPDQNYNVWLGKEITFPENIYTLSEEFSFHGWKVTDSEGSRICQPGDTHTIAGDTTIEGVWTYQIPGAVNVRLDGGSGSSYSMYVNVGSPLDLSGMEQPTKSGYTLVGWANENGTLDPGQLITRDLIDMDENGNPISTEADEDGNIYSIMTLEPVWEAYTDTVTVIYEPGTYGTDTPESTTITLNDTLVFPAAPTADSESRIFDGWVLKKDPARRFAEGQVLVFSDWDFVSGTAKKPQLVFEATWSTQRRSLLRFDSAGGSIVDPFDTTAGSLIKEPEEPYRVGYTFTGWIDEDGKPVSWPYTMPLEGATFTATWTVNSYTIRFSTPEDATQLDPITVPYNTPMSEVDIPKPVRPHYIMYSWFPQLPATMPAENLELTAHWCPYEYGMEFNANGGIWAEPEGGEPDTMYAVGRYGDKVPVIPTPTWEGHSFEGWQIDYIYRDGEEIRPADPDAIVQIPETYPDENIYYIAKWSEHVWSSPEYIWASDYSSVTAVRIALDDESIQDAEIAKTTAKVTTEPGCTTRGETTYTAEFVNPAFETSTLTVKNLNALSHDWGEWVVTTPATETEAGEETCTCLRDPAHIKLRDLPAAWDPSAADFVVPFDEIEEEAFSGIAATHIEVQPTVESIGPRAFADCPSLRRIHIPDSVGYVDQTALDGCENVIVCDGTAAAYLAFLNGFTFVQESAE